MSKVFSGVMAIVTGNSNCKVLASIIRNIDYDTLVASIGGENPGVTRQEFDLFLGDVGGALIEAGVLDEELNLTGQIAASL